MSIKIQNVFLVIVYIIYPQDYIANATPIPHVYNSISVEAEYIDMKYRNYGPKVKYIGEYKDSIYVGLGSQISEQLISRRVTSELKSKYENLKNYDGKISIKLCDKNYIKSVNKNNLDIPTIEISEIMKVGYYIPVVITNIDNVPINIAINFGNTSFIPLFLEVQQADKSWKAFTYYSICWTFPKYNYINPGEIVVLIMPVFKENENHNIRFVIGKEKSNVINQKMNL